MDWANEKYVRLFTRDTVTWKMLPWQSRALLPLILRKLDRSGVLDLGDYGEGAIAAISEVPVEFVQAGLPALLKAKVFAMADGRLSMPNYIPAQETRQSDAQRKRDSREKRAAGGDKGSPEVTNGHQESPRVTLTPDLPHALPQTEPDPDTRARVERLTPQNEPGKPSPRSVVNRYLALRSEIVVGHVAGAKGLSPQPQESDVEKAATWLANVPPDACADIEPAMRLACQHVVNGDPGWNKPEMVKVGYLFGSIVRSWDDLREELHGCAPKLANLKKAPIQVGEKLRLWE
jgi:hypothetical protein